MFPIPNPPPGQLVKDVQRLRRQYEAKRLDSIKKLQAVVKKTAAEEVEYVKSIILPPPEAKVAPNDEEE